MHQSMAILRYFSNFLKVKKYVCFNQFLIYILMCSFRIYVQAMSLTMLKNDHGSKCYLELSSKAFSSCGQNLCKSCHSTPFRCSILSVEFDIKVHCRQLQIIGIANT